MPKVNRWMDFVERVAWTAIQAAAATALATGFDDWKLTAQVSGTAALISALKVIVAQNTGTGDNGSAIPGQVITPPPTK